MTRKRLKFKYKVRRFFFFVFLFILAVLVKQTFFNTASKAVTQAKETSTATAQTTTMLKSAAAQSATQYVQAYLDTSAIDTATATDADYEVPIFQSASAASTKVASMFHGSWALYLGEEGTFYQIKTDSGVTGYIEKEQAKRGTYTTEPVSSLQDITVVLDAGHGGDDSGSLDNSGTIYEKTLTLATAKAVQKTLTAAGVNVIMTRTKSDEYTKLADIATLTNQANADLFISFHYDNYDYANAAKGYTAYYYYDTAKAFAKAVHTQLVANDPLTDRGVKEENYEVIRNTYVPAILLELGYMNNDQDLSQMNTDSYRQMVAAAILSGIKSYYQLD